MVHPTIRIISLYAPLIRGSIRSLNMSWKAVPLFMGAYALIGPFKVLAVD